MKTKAISTSDKSYFRLNSLMFAFILLAFASMTSMAASSVSSILDNNGFKTLKTAIDLLGVTSDVDETTLTLFAPTDDVFDETARALGCKDAIDLATRLAGIDVNGTDALTYVVAYHAYAGSLATTESILSAGTLTTLIGDPITTGVGKEGLYVKGMINLSPSNITTDGIMSDNSSYVYAIDQILLPIDPLGVCAEEEVEDS